MTKAELRKLYRQKRLQLTAGEASAFSQAMLQQFKQTSWPAVNYLFGYQPMAIMNEPGTEPFITHIQNLNSNCITAYPVSDFTNATMQAIAPASQTGWEVNPYHISEPGSGATIVPAQFDMVLVPLLAFDQQGYRAGYGKGFYDKYLAQCRPTCVRVGLSFFGPVPAIADVNEFDVPLTHCITPEQVYVF